MKIQKFKYCALIEILSFQILPLFIITFYHVLYLKCQILPKTVPIYQVDIIILAASSGISIFLV